MSSNQSFLCFQLGSAKAFGSLSRAFFSSQLSRLTEDLVPSAFFCIKFFPLYVSSLLASTDQCPNFWTFHFHKVTSARLAYSGSSVPFKWLFISFKRDDFCKKLYLTDSNTKIFAKNLFIHLRKILFISYYNLLSCWAIHFDELTSPFRLFIVTMNFIVFNQVCNIFDIEIGSFITS